VYEYIDAACNHKNTAGAKYYIYEFAISLLQIVEKLAALVHVLKVKKDPT